MIDTKELRLIVQDYKLAGSPVFIQAADMDEILDRLEAAESECLEQARLNGMGASREAALLAKLEAAEENRSHFLVKIGKLYAQCDALHAKIEQMEKQVPICRAEDLRHAEILLPSLGLMPEDKLYALPGAQTQPAPSIPDGFSREDLEAVAEGLDGYEKTVNVGNVTGEGDDHLESTTAYAARFIRTMLAAAPEAKP